MRSAPAVTLSGILALAAAGLPAEDTAPLAPGRRVRVTMAAGGSRLIGTVLALDDRGLALQVPGRVDALLVRRDDVVGIAVSQGRGSRGRGALIGGVIGAGTGAIVGVVGGLASGSSSDEKALGATASGAVLAFLGGSVGALVGLAVPPAERWGELPPDCIRLSLAPVRWRGVAVSLTFSF